jgi:hypothetical protein
MTNKFSGELKWITPNLLITEGEHNKTESFFLGLAVIFNDLKGLILFEKLLADNYEKPQSEEPTCHAGNYAGTMVQIQKLIASTINEFFIFLKKSDEVFSESEFKQIFGRLSKSDKELWDGMIAAAHDKLPGVAGLLKTIVQIRSNITFHYDHSGKILRKVIAADFLAKCRSPEIKLLITQ